MATTGSRGASILLAAAVALAGMAVPSMAQHRSSTTRLRTAALDAGTMQGFPPPPERWVTRANSFKAQNLRWTLQHVRELVPTKNIWRGAAAPSLLKQSDVDLDIVELPDEQGRTVTLPEALKRVGTDGFLVLHRGSVVYEKYFSGMQPHTPHVAASMTASFTGLLATMLIHEGRLAPYAQVRRYVPELADSGFGDATIQQLLDMQAIVNYGDAYDADTALRGLQLATGSVQRPRGYEGPATICDFLATACKDGEHGSAFRGDCGTVEVLAWVLRRVSGRSWAELLSERIWSKIGAQEDAYVIVDVAGTEQASSGLCMTLRDLARFGEMLRNDGRCNGTQVVAKRVVAEIRSNGDPEIFARSSEGRLRPGYTFHNLWFISNDDYASIETSGKFGQRLYIAPKAEVVIAQFASDPRDSDADVKLMRNAYEAIAKHLAERQTVTATTAK